MPAGDLRSVERALSLRTPDELAALADALVTDPDPAASPAACEVALALFLRVPRAAPRAHRLIDALEAHGHPMGLARLQLALAEGHLDRAAAALDTLADAARVDGLVRLATAALATASARGKDWLVPLPDGVANIALAFARRPALERDLGPAGLWLRELLGHRLHLFHKCDLADAAAHFDLGARLQCELLSSDERDRTLEARIRALGATHFTAPELTPTTLPPSGLIARLGTLANPTLPEAEATHPLDAPLHERLGDLRKAAELHFAAALGSAESLREAVRLRAALTATERRALTDQLAGDPRLTDEVELAADPTLRERATLLLTLAPDALGPLGPARLDAASPPPTPAETRTRPTDDPHHPENRLAAASDLLAAAKVEPAANILAALLRKVDEATPARLFTIVAQALEADEPPADLLHAAHRALNDAHKAPPLLAALTANPTAAFALHEELRAMALSSQHADTLRLRALETWLGIWRATETAPDPDAIRSLREAEAPLLVAAAVSLAGLPSPVAAIRRFLGAYPPHATTPEDFSEALLALSLGRLG